MTDRPKNPAAQALARIRWAKATDADRQACREHGKLGGRPRTAPRCPCGKMTVARAAQRGHKC